MRIFSKYLFIKIKLSNLIKYRWKGVLKHRQFSNRQTKIFIVFADVPDKMVKAKDFYKDDYNNTKLIVKTD